MRVLALALLASLTLAGCATPLVAPAAIETAPETFGLEGAVVAMDACEAACFEPSVAVDAAGRIFVTTHVSPWMAVSEDGGATWSRRDLPAPPMGIPDGAVVPTGPNGLARAVVRGDGTLQADAAGRLFYTAMLGVHAFQVARSDDAGLTWAVNALVLPGATPLTIDRQWLGFAPDGAVYLSYAQMPGGIHVARSDDGGASFGAHVRIAALEERHTIGNHGAPIVRADGRVAVALARGPPTFGPLAQGGAVQVALSDDRGATWRTVDVFVTPQGVSATRAAPVAAFDDAGRLHVLWPRGDTGIEVALASSDDGGESWADPILFGKSSALTGAIAAGPRGLRVAWQDGGAPVAAVTDGALFEARGARAADPSHFAALAIDAEGRAVLAWASGGAVMVARESA